MTKLLDFEKKLGDLILLLENENSDFSNFKKEYEDFCREMKKAFKNTERILEIHRQIISIEMQYAYQLAINGNSAEPDLFADNLEYALNETEMLNIAEILELRFELRELTKNMSPLIWGMYINILEYYSFLETYIPKIAYYEGIKFRSDYNTANENNAKIIYLKYGEILSDYLGINL